MSRRRAGPAPTGSEDASAVAGSPRLVLASASPRRARVLRHLGLDFHIDPARVPEKRGSDEEPLAFAERLAREKAASVAVRHEGSFVIGGDTVVILDDQVLGKPLDAKGAVEMLLRLQGREHSVASGLALAGPHGVVSGVDVTRVRVRPFGEETAQAYVASGEPMDKAGSYGIQGRGGALIRGIDGDYFTVVGMPVALFVDLLESAGLIYTFGGLRAGTPQP